MKSPAEYWSDHILKWENKNYSQISRFNLFSSFVRNRQKRAIEILSENIFEKCSLLEVGCGSGLLIGKFQPEIKIKYTGIDFSRPAISVALKRNYSENIEIKFLEGDMRSGHLPKCDIAIALGVSDWLTRRELDVFLASLNCQLLILSYTRKNNSLALKLFKTYHNLFSSKMRGEGFPKQYFGSEISAILKQNHFETREVFSNVFKYSLGVLIVAKKRSNGK